MKAKEFLNRAFFINQRITSKIEQLNNLNALATKVTTTYSQAPASGSRNNHKMEDVIIKLVDMQNSINADIDKLLDIKAEIMGVINSVESNEYRTILEMRYLCFKTWEEIAAEMNYGVRYIHILHSKALRMLPAKNTEEVE